MSNLPLVTIISICYNHEKYLDEYFSGILNQTYPHMELILFDDCSKDGSWEKICSYKPALERKFKYLTVERHENMGLFKEKALGLKAAKGEFVSTCATDDYYLPTKVEENVKYFMEHPETGLVHSDFDQIVNGEIAEGFWKSKGVDIVCQDPFEDLLLNKYYIVPVTVCTRRELLTQYVDFTEHEKKGYAMEDVPMFLELANRTRFGFINKSLARYRIVSGSMAHPVSLDKRSYFLKSLHRIKLEYAEKFNASEELKRQVLKLRYEGLYNFGSDYFRRNECSEGFSWLLKNYPKQYGTFFYRILAFSTINKLLWRIVKFCEKKQIVYRIRRLFLSFGAK